MGNTHMMTETKMSQSLILQWIGLLSPCNYEDLDELQQYIATQRIKYQELIELHKPFNVNDKIEELSPQVFHPLAQSCFNPWLKEQEDMQLVDLICNDVKRTFQDNAFFTNPNVLESMQRILYIFANNNGNLGYKQGFNDICGICLLVSSQDVIMPNNPNISINLDIESNCYTIMNGLLNTGIKDFYIEPKNNEKPIVVITCEYIFHTLLKKIDLELYNKLIKINLEPHIYLMRWIRLVFAREHIINHTISIWNAFINDYSNCKSLRFINYFTIAMLLNIKTKLMESDINECIQLLFNYSSTINDVDYIDQIIANTISLLNK